MKSGSEESSLALGIEALVYSLETQSVHHGTEKWGPDQLREYAETHTLKFRVLAEALGLVCASTDELGVGPALLPTIYFIVSTVRCMGASD